MRSTMKKSLTAAALAALAALALGCSTEVNDSGTPVHLVVTNSQAINRIDLRGGTGCDASIATVNMQAFPKSADVTGNFVNVRIQRYRVSYVRTDGGKVVPAPFVRSMDSLLTVGGAAQGLGNFLAFEPGALNQAPFAALAPNNGGRDPETGSRYVKMDVIIEVYGQTLGGDEVYGATRLPLDFCYDCQGCA